MAKTTIKKQKLARPILILPLLSLPSATMPGRQPFIDKTFGCKQPSERILALHLLFFVLFLFIISIFDIFLKLDMQNQRARQTSPFHINSQTLSFALLARKFSASSSPRGIITFLEIIFTRGVCPQIHIGKSFGQMHPLAFSRNISLTIRSSNEWNEMIASRPPGLSIPIAD